MGIPGLPPQQNAQRLALGERIRPDAEKHPRNRYSIAFDELAVMPAEIPDLRIPLGDDEVIKRDMNPQNFSLEVHAGIPQHPGNLLEVRAFVMPALPVVRIAPKVCLRGRRPPEPRPPQTEVMREPWTDGGDDPRRDSAQETDRQANNPTNGGNHRD